MFDTTAFVVGRRAHESTLDWSNQVVGVPLVQSSESESTFKEIPGLPSPAMETIEGPKKIEEPRHEQVLPAANVSASLIQIWEGTVHEVLDEQGTMRSLLHAKLNEIPDHFADIDLEWVMQQDRDLVKPGAVFYLSLYKVRHRGGTIVNAQELRFRRLPTWTKRDAILIRETSLRLRDKGRIAPEAP